MPIDTASNSTNKELKNNLVKDYLNQFSGDTVPSTSETRFFGSDLGIDPLTSYDGYVDLENKNILRQDINKMRAENQGNFRQFAYGTAGGVSKGVLHAIGGAANLLDFDAYLNHLQGINDTEQNWLSELTNSGAETVGEAMPIYQEDPSKVFDFSDGASYFKAWEGLVDSAVQFAIPGGLITKGIGAAMKGVKMMQWISQLATKSPTLAKIVQNTPASVVMNLFESNIAGYELAKEIKGELIAARDKGEVEITDEEIEDRAQEAFNDNRIFYLGLLPITGLQTMGLVKGQGFTRNLLKDRSTLTNRFKNFGSSLVAPNADNLVLQGLGEAGEEITQGVMSGESKYQALKGTGIEEGNPNFLERVKEYATSDQALLEGAMGFLGGGVQRVMMEGVSGQYSKTSREEYNKRYNEQQAFLEKMKDFTQGKTLLNVQKQVEKEQLIKEGRTVEADMLDRAAFKSLVIEASKLGTMEMVENQLNDIIKGTSLENQDELLGEEAKEKAAEYLREAKEIEKMWLKHIDSPLHTDLFDNRLASTQHTKDLDEVNREISRLNSVIADDVVRRVEPILPSTKRGETYSYDLNEVISAAIEDLKESYKQKATIKRDTRGNEFNTLVEGLKGSEDFYRLAELQLLQKDLIEELNGLDTEFREMNTAKGYQKKVKENEVKQKRYQEIVDLYKTHTKEISTVTPSKGAKVLDEKGIVYTVGGFDSKNNKIPTVDSSGKKVEFTPEEFIAKFRNPTNQTYTTFIGKDIVEERKAEQARKEKTTTMPNSKEHKSNVAADKDKDTPKDLASKRDGVTVLTEAEDGTPTYATAKVKQSEETNSLKGNSLAWSSFNNIDEKNSNRPLTEDDENIASYLENPENNLVGTTVELKYAPTEEFGDKITATLLDNSGNPITHKGTPIVLHVRRQGSLRDTLGETIKTHGVVYTTITEKTNGYIQFQKGKDSLTKLDLATGKRAEEMDIYIQVVGEFVAGNIINDGLSEYVSNKEEGQVVVEVPTANGKPFPLRATVNLLSTEEAEIIYDLYVAMLQGANFSTPLSDTGYEHIVGKLDKVGLSAFLNPKTAIFKDALNLLTSHNNKEASFPLYSKNHTVFYGNIDEKSVGSFHKSVLEDPKAAEGAKKQFINWLTTYKTKNVYWKLLENPKYKAYLVNNVLSTKARYNENGVVFAQPMIVVDPKVSTTNNSSSQKTTTSSTIDIKEIEAKIQEVLANKDFIKLSEDGRSYVNTKTGKKYKRVSDVISEEEIDSDNQLVQSSLKIGTKVDELVRDFFSGKLKDLSQYDVSSKAEIESFLKQLEVIKANFEKRKETVLANDIVLYNDALGIAGTVDLLTYDTQGNIHIYDMKTMRGNNFIESYGTTKYDSEVVFEKTGQFKPDGSPKYRIVAGASQDSKRTKHTKQLSLYRILLNNTHGLKAKTLGIMPIEIAYNPGDTITTKLNLLTGVKLNPLDKVKDAELAALEESKGGSTTTQPTPSSLNASSLLAMSIMENTPSPTPAELEASSTIPSEGKLMELIEEVVQLPSEARKNALLKELVNDSKFWLELQVLPQTMHQNIIITKIDSINNSITNC